MRFLIGVALGFGIGFAGAVLFAPDRSRRRQVDWSEGTVESGPAAFESDRNVMAAVRRTLRSVQEQVSEALEEAKKAQAEAEKDLRERYEKRVRDAAREAEEAVQVDEAKRKVKGKKKE